MVAVPGPQGPHEDQDPPVRLQRNGKHGIGKPEALKHDSAGYWSRRITDEHRLVCEIVGDEVGASAPAAMCSPGPPADSAPHCAAGRHAAAGRKRRLMG